MEGLLIALVAIVALKPDILSGLGSKSSPATGVGYTRPPGGGPTVNPTTTGTTQPSGPSTMDYVKAGVQVGGSLIDLVKSAVGSSGGPAGNQLGGASGGSGGTASAPNWTDITDEEWNADDGSGDGSGDW